MIALVSELNKSCKIELRNIMSCAECYESMHMRIEPDWQSLACARPHLVLWVVLDASLDFWAAKEDYVCWPAKLVAIDEKSAIVIFFKDDENTGFVEVDQSDCFVYSQEVPRFRLGNLEKFNFFMKNVLGVRTILCVEISKKIINRNCFVYSQE